MTVGVRSLDVKRHFFHLRTDRGLEPDGEGLLLPDLDRACLEARRAIPGLAAEFIAAGRDPMDFRFEITDGDGVLLLAVPFRERARK